MEQMVIKYKVCQLTGPFHKNECSVVECKVLRKELYDIKKHASVTELFNATNYPTFRTGSENTIGAIIKYKNPYTNTRESKWVPLTELIYE